MWLYSVENKADKSEDLCHRLLVNPSADGGDSSAANAPEQQLHNSSSDFKRWALIATNKQNLL